MKNQKKFIPSNGFIVHGYTVYKFNYLEGRIRTLVEALGLPERQEKSLTDLLLNEIWSIWDKPEYTYQYDGISGIGTAKLID